MNIKTINQKEISVILWCMESMASDFQPGDDSTLDFDSAFAKIESLSDCCEGESLITLSVD